MIDDTAACSPTQNSYHTFVCKNETKGYLNCKQEGFTVLKSPLCETKIALSISVSDVIQ